MTADNKRRGQSTAAGRSALLLAVLLGAVAWAGLAIAEDNPEPPPSLPLVRLFQTLKESMADLPPFFRDTSLKIYFRSYYFNRENPDASENEAWAFGGWLGYRSGWLLDTFGIGATFYGSAPLYAPADKDGTGLLETGQEGYHVLGEAYAALRYQDYALLRGYRQLVDQPYVNAHDVRMTPITFEGVTLGGKAGPAQYMAGYLWKIKPRNSDTFVSMSSQAGATGTDDGLVMGGVRLTPMTGLRVDVAEQYGINTFNTFYVEGEYLLSLNDDWTLRLGAQFTDQRAVGDELVANAAEKSWNTQTGGARVQGLYQDLTLSAAFSITASGNTVQSPWGSYPGYLSAMFQDFDRANEKAVLVGAAYDFSKTLTEGLSAFVNLVRGWDAINPQTRAKAGNQAEYDVTVDYRPPWKTPALLQGMWLRVRGAILDQQGADQLGWQIRLILNWERDLL
jgi:hypothetical protein